MSPIQAQDGPAFLLGQGKQRPMPSNGSPLVDLAIGCSPYDFNPDFTSEISDGGIAVGQLTQRQGHFMG